MVVMFGCNFAEDFKMSVKKLTLKKLMKIKEMLDDAEEKRPKTFIKGVEYILVPKLEKE